MLIHIRNHLHRQEAAHVVGLQLGLAMLACFVLALASLSARPAQARLDPAAWASRHDPRANVLLASAPAPAVTADAGSQVDAGLIRLQDLNPEEARRWNASQPIAAGPNAAAKPFHLETEGVLDEARAADCMTAAVYYEAGFESTDGQRAVAQVVLNRLRNPLFPKTVCGVVFQGSERTSGCQFTFACDGALARKPDEAAWERARKVALAALHGYVMKRVGNATHYHADYVAPYWSPTLVKVAVVGQHIFYRWTGGLGLPPAFGGRYAGGEMQGLTTATLDNLSRGSGKLEIAQAAGAQPPPEVRTSAASEPVAEIAPAPAPDVVAVSAIATAAPAKPEEVDWQGRPRQKAPPRLALPSGPMGPTGPGGF